MRVGVDVDDTVVDVTGGWFDWAHSLVFSKPKLTKCDQLFDPYITDQLSKMGLQPLDYWNNERLYDTATPFPDSVRVLKELADQGHEIIFISKVIGNHGESKKRFINRWFPFNSGIVFTDDKYLVNVDVMVDDREYMLNKFPFDVLKLCFWSPYNTEERLVSTGVRVRIWGDVYKKIMEESN